MLLDMDKLSDNKLGAASSACYIGSVNEWYVNTIGKTLEDNQVVTIPKMVQEGLKNKQYKASQRWSRRDFRVSSRSVQCSFSHFSK